MFTSRTSKIKHQINVLLDSGEINKSKIYEIISTQMGVARPTVRRVARELRNEIEKKIFVLSDTNKLYNIGDAYLFIPKKRRESCRQITQQDIIPVKCFICKKPIANVVEYCDNLIVCDKCKIKFPERPMVKKKNEK